MLPNQIIKIEKLCDLEDTKRIWSNVFNPYVEEDSKPLCLNYDQDMLNLKLKEQEKNVKLDKITNDYAINKMLSRLGQDDLDSIGDDISKEEFIENEIFWETLD